MSLSLGPFITCFITIAFLAVYLHIVLYRSKSNHIYGVRFIFIGITILFVRLCFPINFPFTYTIYSYKILPLVTNFLWEEIGESSYNVYQVFFIICMAVAVIKLIIYFVKKIRLQRYLSEYMITDSLKYPNIVSSVTRCASDSLRIAVIPHNISPSITGVLHTTLIFPALYESLSDKELDYICTHEINHYRNKDLWIKLLLEILSCIHWWNPLIYWVKKEYSLALELVNDYQVMETASVSQNTEYAELLLQTTKRLSDSPHINFNEVIPFVRKLPSDLNIRISFLTKKLQKTPKKLTTVIHNILICIMIIISLLVVIDPSSRRSMPADGTFEVNQTNTYFVQTSEGYNIYIEGQFVGFIKELPEDMQNYKIYKQGDLVQ